MEQVEVGFDSVGSQQLGEFFDRLLPLRGLFWIPVGVAVGPADQRSGSGRLAA
jgi:hypothetical protein